MLHLHDTGDVVVPKLLCVIQTGGSVCACSLCMWPPPGSAAVAAACCRLHLRVCCTIMFEACCSAGPGPGESC